MSDKINIVAHIHPFAPSQRIIKELDHGQSVQEILDSLITHDVGRIIIAIDGEQIKDFAYIPKPDANIVIRVLPAGGDTQDNVGKGGFWTGIAGVGLMVIGGLTAQPWLVAIGVSMVVSGVALVGSAILMDLFTPPGAGPQSERLPSIRGGRNRANPWGKVPVLFGTHLTQPMYAALSYTSIDGTDGVDMYLHTIMAVSVHARTGGNVLLTNIKVGETQLASNVASQLNGEITNDGPFSATIQVYNDGTNSSLYPEIVTEDAPGVELDSTISGDNLWRTTPPEITKVSIDITLPRGLYKYDSDGDLKAHSVTVTVKRRVTGSGTAWADAVTAHTFSLTKTITKTARYTFSEALDSGQYDYAVTRSANDAAAFRGTSMIQWTAYRSIKTGVRPIDATIQASLCVLAIKIKATADLQGTIDQINCIAQQSVPIYSGGVWTSFGYSENPAALLVAAMRGPANARPIEDGSIDWTTIQNWYTTCATKGWTCNFMLQSPSRLRDILATIAQTGRATHTLRDGLYSVIVDESKSTVIQHFAARNVRNYSWQKSFADLHHALKINYISADDGYSPAEVIVYADDYTILNATKFQQVTLTGVTDSDLAWKHGRYLLAVEKLRPEVYTFETDAEGIVAEPGDLVRVAHDSIAIGLISSRIKEVTLSGVNAVAITIDETVIIEAEKTYAVRMRLSSDNSSVYSTLSNAAGYEGNTLIFTSPVATIPAVGDLVLFGLADIESIETIIIGIEMLDDLACRIYVTDRADAVHTADSGEIPEYDSKITRPPQIGTSTAPPTAITVAVVKVVGDIIDAQITNQSLEALAIAEMPPPGNLGRHDSAHPEAYNDDDYWTVYDTDDDPIERGVYWSNAGTPERITIASSVALQAKMADALVDVAWAEANGYGTSEDYGFSTLFVAIASVSALFTTLGAKTAFIESIFANEIEATGGIRVYDGQGVNKRCMQLKDSSLDMLDTPDGGTEQLRARIGRLGVGPILHDGEHLANITTPWSAESVINGAITYVPEIITQSNSTLRSVYRRSADSYLVQRTSTDDGVTWSAESVINGAATTSASPIEQSDGVLRCAYVRAADSYLVQRTSTDNGVTWSAESEINAAASSDPNIIEQSNGTLRAAYLRGSDDYLVQRTSTDDGATWSAESVINGAVTDWPHLLEQSNGTIRCSYTRQATDDYLVQRTSTDDGVTWSAESAINAAASYFPNIFEQLNRWLICVYRSGGYVVIKTSTDDGVTWSAEGTVNSASSTNPCVTQQSNGTVICAYIRTADTYLCMRTLQRYARIGAGIVESGGTLTGGYYDKYSNGKLEAYIKSGARTWSAGTDQFCTFTFTFPTAVPFVETPVVSSHEISSSGSNIWSNGGTNAISATAVTISRHWVSAIGGNNPNANGYTLTFYVKVTGRWK